MNEKLWVSGLNENVIGMVKSKVCGVEVFADRGSTILVLIVGLANMWRPSLFMRS
jgi:hypothetical protein